MIYKNRLITLPTMRYKLKALHAFILVHVLVDRCKVKRRKLNYKGSGRIAKQSVLSMISYTYLYIYCIKIYP